MHPPTVVGERCVGYPSRAYSHNMRLQTFAEAEILRCSKTAPKGFRRETGLLRHALLPPPAQKTQGSAGGQSSATHPRTHELNKRWTPCMAMGHVFLWRLRTNSMTRSWDEEVGPTNHPPLARRRHTGPLCGPVCGHLQTGHAISSEETPRSMTFAEGPNGLQAGDEMGQALAYNSPSKPLRPSKPLPWSRRS